jgi:hypothetical protein
MSISDRPSPHKFESADEEVARYRALSSLALVGLLAGLLSPLAMFSSLLWLVPLAAMVVSGLALRRIAARRSDLVGRPAALAGLVLGVTFLVAAPVSDMLYRHFLRQQARQFAQIWIDAVRQGDKFKAHHLMIEPGRRLPLESNLAVYYAKKPQWQRMLDEFCKEPAMKLLFALGPKAEIRFYETAAEGRTDIYDVVKQTYAVTYEDAEKQQKTFFITLVLQRSVNTGSRQANWTLAGVEGPPGP